MSPIAPVPRRGTPSHAPHMSIEELHREGEREREREREKERGASGLTVRDPDLEPAAATGAGTGTSTAPHRSNSASASASAVPDSPREEDIHKVPSGRRLEQLEAKDAVRLLPPEIPQPRLVPGPGSVPAPAPGSASGATLTVMSVTSVTGTVTWPSSPAPLHALGDDTVVSGRASTASLLPAPAQGGAAYAQKPHHQASEVVWNLLCSLVDFVNPAQPGKITPLDIKRSMGAGTALFDALITMQPLQKSGSGGSSE
jgi:hypothetical protein